MLRHRLLLVGALGVAAGFLVVLRLRAPTSTIPEQPAPPPPSRVQPRKAALQSDAEGYYVPGYRLQRCLARLHARSEEHTSELQSLRHLVCRLLLEKKKKETKNKDDAEMLD